MCDGSDAARNSRQVCSSKHELSSSVSALQVDRPGAVPVRHVGLTVKNVLSAQMAPAAK